MNEKVKKTHPLNETKAKTMEVKPKAKPAASKNGAAAGSKGTGLLGWLAKK